MKCIIKGTEVEGTPQEMKELLDIEVREDIIPSDIVPSSERFPDVVPTKKRRKFIDQNVWVKIAKEFVELDGEKTIHEVGKSMGIDVLNYSKIKEEISELGKDFEKIRNKHLDKIRRKNKMNGIKADEPADDEDF